MIIISKFLDQDTRYLQMAVSLYLMHHHNNK
ncbi:hypothetical protein DERF_006441 [Dermatophagoides farinae]|uniref:Uncharacterized protein n=1 Tax=Dermatophagoides farinae TaxID=6954 RepID=A0A922I665_DERFA|nr:hypothetical protein DERF_006441 [Dermatophagoides farinae]